MSSFSCLPHARQGQGLKGRLDYHLAFLVSPDLAQCWPHAGHDANAHRCSRGTAVYGGLPILFSLFPRFVSLVAASKIPGFGNKNSHIGQK